MSLPRVQLNSVVTALNDDKRYSPGSVINDSVFANYGMRVDINGFIKLSDEDVERIAKAVVKEIFPILKVINAD